MPTTTPSSDSAPLTRRELLARSLRLAAAAYLGVPAAAAARSAEPVAGGLFVETVPFADEGREWVGRLVGDGLDGRRALDLSALGTSTVVTPTDRFYVRTRYPAGEPPAEPWRVEVGGLVRRKAQISLEQLMLRSRAQGAHLMECAGNGPQASFGLIGAATWAGVPLAPLVPRLGALPAATQLLVVGFDDHPEPSGRSVPGASWIFSFDQLEATGAFLATLMNGEALAADHGRPVRLVVPGWYGCASIKWVTGLELVDDSAPATEQMVEFADRTLQTGQPRLARDFRPAAIDLAAMPVRVERWRVEGADRYRVVGVKWGGERPTDRLTIRFEPGGAPEPVADQARESTSTWSLWSHSWRPPGPGRFTIRMGVDDSGIATRRLDRGDYDRSVLIR